jgi:hypothetical protein
MDACPKLLTRGLGREIPADSPTHPAATSLLIFRGLTALGPEDLSEAPEAGATVPEKSH